jgi:probable rRNA maturation factor
MSLPALELALQFGDFPQAPTHRRLLTRARVKRWVAMALLRPGEISVRIVGTAEGQALNRQYRGKDYATNVLTFDYAREPLVAADLVLCGPVVEREAREQRKPLEAHYAHLLVHGTLHAQGYDHERGELEALEMEAVEVLLLAALGFANPPYGPATSRIGIVTGPSLTRCTCMSAANSPVCTSGWAARACATR